MSDLAEIQKVLINDLCVKFLALKKTVEENKEKIENLKKENDVLFKHVRELARDPLIHKLKLNVLEEKK